MTETKELQLAALFTKEVDREADKNFNVKWSGATIMDVPEAVFVFSILLKLTIKELVMVKCSCKAWHLLISDPRFAEIYFKQANPSLLIRILSGSCVPRTCYLLESSKNFWIRDGTLKLDAKLKIPLRDPTAACNLDKVVNSGRESKRKRYVKLRPADQKFRISNSCNGFLCLSELVYFDPVVVCNPVTGDYINLPDSRRTYGESDCGIGFSLDANQYKVVRIFNDGPWKSVPCPGTGKTIHTHKVAEVNTLGTPLWRRVGYSPMVYPKQSLPVYLNGALHWFCLEKSLSLIFAFDLNEECFREVPEPPSTMGKWNSRVAFLSMGVLRGCLCLSDAYRDAPLKLWLMKKYAAKESWTLECSIDMQIPYSQAPPYYQPITYLGCGVLLLCHYPGHNLLCYNPQTCEVKFLKLSRLKAKCEAVFYTPNLMMMRDVIGEFDAQIRNVNSVGGEIKIHGESKDHCLVVEDSEAFKIQISPRGRVMRWNLIL